MIVGKVTQEFAKFFGRFSFEISENRYNGENEENLPPTWKKVNYCLKNLASYEKGFEK